MKYVRIRVETLKNLYKEIRRLRAENEKYRLEREYEAKATVERAEKMERKLRLEGTDRYKGLFGFYF
jgi:hypothetical protein